MLILQIVSLEYFLASSNRDPQTVFSWSNGAGPTRIVGTVGVVRIIEINQEHSVSERMRLQIASSPVGFFASQSICEG